MFQWVVMAKVRWTTWIYEDKINTGIFSRAKDLCLRDN